MRRSLAMLVLLALAAVPARAGAQSGVDETCSLTLTKFDPATVNVAYPDDSAQYYSAAYQLAPGTRIRVHGRFPHARYMSFNAYDAAQRPLDGLSDVVIKPDPGSGDPFVFGAERTFEQRDYTVFIDTGPKPAQRAPNTIYTGTGQNGAPNTSGIFIYRIYIPDKGRDDTGGVGLPTVTVEPSDGSGANGQPSPCADQSKPKADGVNDAVAQQALPDRPSSPTDNPRWRKFVNVASSVAIGVTGQPAAGPVDLDQAGGSGGFLSNLDNAYVSSFIDRSGGQVVVTRFRAPTFPDTRPPAARMPGGQLRYWSVCTNDPATQRFVACANDDRSVVAPDGFVTYVVSTPEQRPVNATRQCYVNWLPWGPSARGVMIYRNMLPEAGFAQSIQRAKVDHERDTMAEYFPRSLYLAGKKDFEARGCSYAAAAPPTIITAPARSCSSRRTVHVTGPRGIRSATVRVGPRVRRVKVRGRHVLVDMRGLPKGRYSVTIRAGRHVLRRAYLTCTPKARRNNP